MLISTDIEEESSLIGKSIFEVWPRIDSEALELAMAGVPSTREKELDSRWYRTAFTPLRATSDGDQGEVSPSISIYVLPSTLQPRLSKKPALSWIRIPLSLLTLSAFSLRSNVNS